MKIYGYTVICSDGLLSGRESQTYISAKKGDLLNRAYIQYRQMRKSAMVSKQLDIKLDTAISKDDFATEIFEEGVIIYCRSHHITFEGFTCELEDVEKVKEKKRTA